MTESGSWPNAFWFLFAVRSVDFSRSENPLITSCSLAELA